MDNKESEVEEVEVASIQYGGVDAARVEASEDEEVGDAMDDCIRTEYVTEVENYVDDFAIRTTKRKVFKNRVEEQIIDTVNVSKVVVIESTPSIDKDSSDDENGSNDREEASFNVAKRLKDIVNERNQIRTKLVQLQMEVDFLQSA